MKIGHLKFEHNGKGVVKIAKHWGHTQDEEWQQYLSREDWEKVVKAMDLPASVAKIEVSEDKISKKKVK